MEFQRSLIAVLFSCMLVDTGTLGLTDFRSSHAMLSVWIEAAMMAKALATNGPH